MELTFFSMLFLLIAGHFLADYALQNDFVANAKNHTTDLGKLFWKWVLPAHGFIHALPVFLITQSLVLALVEVVLHCFIDWLKCDGKISFNMDQSLHIILKLFYVLAVFNLF